MANRRIKDLTPQAALDTTFMIAVDKTGETEATSVELSTLISVLGIASEIRTGTGTPSMDVTQTYTFSTPFASTSYVLMVYCFNVSGDEVAKRITNRTANGFDALTAEDCRLDYIAIAL